jgi:tetratricopeptide (TPR) repeat protein
METKFKLNFVDINAVNSDYCNPKKAWLEMLSAIKTIYVNFKKSQIDPEELIDILKEDEKNKNSIPDVASIDLLIKTINRYINEYKIPSSTTIFLEFSRTAAIYLFSIGSREKSLEILREIIAIINEANETTKKNEDINLICVKDCVKINQACINFWYENFEESRNQLEEVITYYESTEDELYLIKMVNFVSVGLTYLAWIYTKMNEFEDAAKAFYHALQVISAVKKHSKERLQDEKFINTKTKKIFIYGKYKYKFM